MLTISCTPSNDSTSCGSPCTSTPTTPSTVRLALVDRWTAKPMPSRRSTTFSTSAGVALSCITTTTFVRPSVGTSRQAARHAARRPAPAGSSCVARYQRTSARSGPQPGLGRPRRAASATYCSTRGTRSAESPARRDDIRPGRCRPRPRRPPGRPRGRAPAARGRSRPRPAAPLCAPDGRDQLRRRPRRPPAARPSRRGGRSRRGTRCPVRPPAASAPASSSG